MFENILLTFNTQTGCFILNCIYTYAKVQSVQGLAVCKQCKCNIPIAHIEEKQLKRLLLRSEWMRVKLSRSKVSR